MIPPDRTIPPPPTPTTTRGDRPPWSLAALAGVVAALIAVQVQDERPNLVVLLALLGITGAAIGLAVLRGRPRAAPASTTDEHRDSERLAAVVRHATDAVLLVDVDGIVVWTNESARTVIGVDRLLGKRLLQCGNRDGSAAADEALRVARTMRPGDVLEVETTVRRDDGRRIALAGTIVNLLDDPDVAALVATLRDVTGPRRLEHELHHLALRDQLTGLTNRNLFLDRTEHALTRRSCPSESVAVLVVDLQDFAAINDVYGHEAGDDLLRQVGDRLTKIVRPADTVARIGGDEFAILLECVSSAAAAIVVGSRIAEVLRMPFDVAGVAIPAPASIGIALASSDSSATALLRNADIATTAARLERSGVRLHQPVPTGTGTEGTGSSPTP